MLPILVLIAAGRLVGEIPAAARHGLHSAAGHRMISALAVTGAAYAAALLLGPVQSALSSIVKWRLVYRTQDRLIAAVSRPVGIAHLEDPKVLDDLALAQGQLASQRRADAPMTLALVVSNRASGLLACAVLASWRWWLGLGMVAMWIVVRRPQLPHPRQGGALRRGLRGAAAGLVPAAAGGPAGRGQGVAGVRPGRVAGRPLPVAVAAWHGRPLGGAAAAGPDGSGSVRPGAAAPSPSPAGTSGWPPTTGRSISAPWPSCCRCWPRPRRSATSPGTTWRCPGCSRGFPGRGQLEAALAPRGPTCPAAVGRPGLPLPRRPLRAGALPVPGRRTVTSSTAWTWPSGPGRSTALVGINGAGKTTLVKLLARLHDPVAGRILVDGADLARLDPSAWQRQVAVVFQDFAHYPLSFAENIGFGAPAHAG